MKEGGREEGSAVTVPEKCPSKWYTLCLLVSRRPLISYIRKFYYYDPQEEVYLSLKEAQLISKQKQGVEPST